MPKLRITNQHNKKSKRRTIGKVKKIGNKYTREIIIEIYTRMEDILIKR